MRKDLMKQPAKHGLKGESKTHHCGRCAWGDFASEQRFGACRKLPPSVVVIDGDTVAAWPVVFVDDWCGQFSPRRERPWTMQTSPHGDGSGQ